MRVTPGMTAANALYNLQQGREKSNKIQEQVASGLVINRPSDDPIATRQILELESKIKEGSQYSNNIKKGTMWLNVADTTLTGMADIIGLAKKAASDVANGTTDTSIIDNTVSQLTELKKRLVDLGNTQIGDQYIFAGFKNNVAPFSGSTFSGTSDSIDIEIERNSVVGINVSGSDVLKGTGSYGSVDILGTLDTLITDITGGNTAGIQQGIRDLVSATTQVSNAQSDVASRLLRMDSAQNMVDRTQNTLKNIISNVQEVDYTKAALELTQQQTALEAALSTTAKITNLSLLDYLQ